MASPSKDTFVYDVFAHPHVAAWLLSLAQRLPQSFVRLTKANLSRLTRALGPASKNTASPKRHPHVWKVERGNLVLWVMTGPLGTCFSVYYPGPLDGFIGDDSIALQIETLLADLLKSLSQSRTPFKI
jgi:hypothetical protein